LTGAAKNLDVERASDSMSVAEVKRLCRGPKSLAQLVRLLLPPLALLASNVKVMTASAKRMSGIRATVHRSVGKLDALIAVNKEDRMRRIKSGNAPEAQQIAAHIADLQKILDEIGACVKAAHLPALEGLERECNARGAQNALIIRAVDTIVAEYAQQPDAELEALCRALRANTLLKTRSVSKENVEQAQQSVLSAGLIGANAAAQAARLSTDGLLLDIQARDKLYASKVLDTIHRVKEAETQVKDTLKKHDLLDDNVDDFV
jgi:hypothetical protein